MTELDRIEILERALQREKAARKKAEAILEEKSFELYQLSQQLKEANDLLKESLNEKSSELEGVFINIVDAYVLLDMNANIVKMNDAAYNMLDYNIEDQNVNLFDLIDDKYQDQAHVVLNKLFRDGQYKNFITYVYTKNGYRKKVQINASVIKDRNGKPVAVQGIVRDITLDTAIRKQLEEQKRQLEIIVENSPVGISLTRNDFEGVLMVNQKMCDMMGYTKQDFTKMQVQDLTHPDDEDISEKHRDFLNNGSIDTFTLEKRYIKKDNSILWSRTTVTAVRDLDGSVKYHVAILEDITSQRISTLKIKESENRLATLITNLQTGILLEDEHRKIQVVNNKFLHMFGIQSTPEMMKGLDCSGAAQQFKHLFLEPEKFNQGIQKIVKNKKPVLREEIALYDGRIFERSYIPIFHNGDYKGHLWSYDDITLQKKYKQNLEAEKEKFGNIIANMNLGLLELDLDDSILFVNQSFCQLTGYTESELIGKKIDDFLKGENKKAYEKRIAKRREGITDSYEMKLFDKQGAEHYWLVSGAPNYDLKGKLVGSIGIHLDITEHKKLQLQTEELLRSLEKQNEHLNDYAHVVSHDLKSPLRSISALLNWTKEDFKTKIGEEALQNLNLMEEKVEKMDHLIENILKYSSIGTENMFNQKLDLNEVIQSIEEMIFIPDHITISVTNTLPTISANPTRIQQLFQNLLSNAVNYIDKPKGYIEIGSKEDDDYYYFSIKDNGIGIAKENFEKIFKMFNALNNTKTSSGIGLSIVKKIIELYEGDIWLESTLGEGTTFYFTLKKDT